MGTSPPGSSYNSIGKGMPLINGPVEFSFGSFGKTVRTKFTTAPNKLCRENDLILCVRGSTTGRMNIADFDACIGRGVAAIRAKEYQAWINWFVRFNRQKIYALGTGSTFPNISSSALTGMEIPVPPLPEQRRIVGILDEAFDGIATAQANAELNLQNARALFESYLNGVFIRDADKSLIKRLGEVCTFSSGGTPSKKNDGYWKGNIPWISGRDMKSTRLMDAALHISQKAVDESSTRMAPAGSLLTLVRGMGLAHGAQIAELMVPCAFNQDIRAIHPNRGVVPRYLLFAVKTRINTDDKVMSNAAHGTMKIDMEELKSVEISLPFHERQEQIVRQIDLLSEASERLQSLYQRKLAALDELKQSLLHQAFSGQL